MSVFRIPDEVQVAEVSTNPRSPYCYVARGEFSVCGMPIIRRIKGRITNEKDVCPRCRRMIAARQAVAGAKGSTP